MRHFTFLLGIDYCLQIWYNLESANFPQLITADLFFFANNENMKSFIAPNLTFLDSYAFKENTEMQEFIVSEDVNLGFSILEKHLNENELLSRCSGMN